MGKKPAKISLDNEAVKEILSALLAEFKQKNFGAAELRDGYEGLSRSALKSICCEMGAISSVDFDLAFEDLEEARLIGTGPFEMYENQPGSEVLIVASYSTYEFSHLTQDGYKAASTVKPAHRPRVPSTTVHITDSTFHQSQIGIGGQVQQTQNTSTASNELFSQLRDEIAKHVSNEEKRYAALAHLKALEDAPDKPTKIERYNQFMGSIADHITVFAPMLTLLLAQITS